MRQVPLLATPPGMAWTAEQLSESYFGELLALYPQAARPTAMYHSQVFSATCALAVIINNILTRCYGMGKHSGLITFTDAMHFRVLLLDWQKSLPNPLRIESVVFPAQLKLQ